MAQRYLAREIKPCAAFRPPRRRSRAPHRAGLQANHTASGRSAVSSNGRGERQLPQEILRLSTLPEDTPLATLVDCANWLRASNVITEEH